MYDMSGGMERRDQIVSLVNKDDEERNRPSI